MWFVEVAMRIRMTKEVKCYKRVHSAIRQFGIVAIGEIVNLKRKKNRLSFSFGSRRHKFVQVCPEEGGGKLLALHHDMQGVWKKVPAKFQ